MCVCVRKRERERARKCMSKGGTKGGVQHVKAGNGQKRKGIHAQGGPRIATDIFATNMLDTDRDRHANKPRNHI